MYGLIVKIAAAPGKREEMIRILKESAADMPGCLRYVVAEDSANEKAIWVTEVWDARRVTRLRYCCRLLGMQYLKPERLFRVLRSSRSQIRYGERGCGRQCEANLADRFLRARLP